MPTTPLDRSALQVVLDRAAARHGGWDRWQSLGAIELEVEHLGGAIPWIKGLGRTHPHPTRLTVWPRLGRTVFHGYPDPAHDIWFQRGRMAQVPRGQTPPLPDHDYRSRFDGLAKLRRWSPIDAAYFFGYALSHYLSLPFALASADIIAHDHRPDRALTDRITVRYPAGTHTHGARERFCFDGDGLLTRHDYHAQIIAPGAHGAHFSRDYVEHHGLWLARDRRVYLDAWGWATPISVLDARLKFSAD